MQQRLIEDKIRSILVKQLKNGGLRPNNIKNTEALINQGLIDSLGAIELVIQLEEAFKIKISPEEMTEANFDSITKITNFINAKSKHK